MERIDVCICEPFMLAGTLPTLAPAILKASLEKEGYITKVFYPSIEFFYEYKIMQNKDILRLIDDIPLQIVDFFFSKNVNVVGELKKAANKEVISESVLETLIFYREELRKKLIILADKICMHNPKILCCSLTFGGLDFVEALFQEVKKRNKNIFFVVGGSNCTIDFSRTILKQTSSIQYVICDETADSLLKLTDALIHGVSIQLDSISYKNTIAKRHIVAEDLDRICCPDFDDYFEVIKNLGFDTRDITLPYEISRGCWWCEKKPRVMCGFYGVRKKFIIKSPEIVIKDLTYLKKRYGICKIRFSDLVNPSYEYLKQLTPLGLLDMKLFWELRPDINEKMMDKLREIGVTFAQIGLESLNTSCLLHMNKGTSGINNIFLLILADTYKIDFVWNHLYGFPWDSIDWYEDIIESIPYLYHLQPPIPRQVWINKYSDWYYEEVEKDELINEYQKLSDIKDSGLKTFFTVKINDEKLQAIYMKLKEAIIRWNNNRKNGYALYIDYADSECLHVVREYEEIYHFRLSGLYADIYIRCFEPISKERLFTEVSAPLEDIENVLAYLVDMKIMIYMDSRYLSLAVRRSGYKWTDPVQQVMNMREGS